MSGLRKNIMLGTAGHVDHGKTALVKMLTGCDTDTLAEEKQRGMTIDLGFAPCRLADQRIVGVVDVPGHVDFIRNMVAGAQGIDVVILVVAADDGVMPQTREHLNILSLMGLRHGLVALTKIDLVEPDLRALVKDDVQALLAGTFLERAPICPLSNITGEGYDAFFDVLNAVVDSCEAKSCSGRFRLWVEDVFTIRGFGTVVTGIPTHGRVRPGDAVTVVPGDLSGRVRRLQVYGEEAPEGRAGECVALNLAEINHTTVHRGQVIGEPDTFAPVTMAEAELRLLDSAKGELKDNAEVHLHIGTAALLGQVAMLETPRLAPGQTQLVQLRLDQPLGLSAGERFVIRAGLKGAEQAGLATIGGGRILGVSNVRLRRRKSWTLESLNARRGVLDDAGGWCDLMLKQADRALTVAELAKTCLLRPDEVLGLLAILKHQRSVLTLPDGTWIHRAGVESTGRRILEILQAFHQANPQRMGLELEVLRSEVNVDRSAFDLTISTLIPQGRIEVRDPLVALAGWQAQVSTEDEDLSERIAATLLQAGWTVPTLMELAEAWQQPLPRVEKAAQLLVERGRLVRLEPRLVMHHESVAAAQQVVLRLLTSAPAFSTMLFRDTLGVSRKYAVPLLDHFDAVRLTVRVGNNRIPGAEAKKLLGRS